MTYCTFQIKNSAIRESLWTCSIWLCNAFRVDKEYAQLAHHNFLFSNDSKRNYREVFHDKVLPQDPTIYLVNSNKSDPTQAPEGHENLKVLPHIPYIQNQPFTEEQYSDFRERVLDKLEKWGLQTYVNISYMKIFDATRY